MSDSLILHEKVKKFISSAISEEMYSKVRFATRKILKSEKEKNMSWRKGGYSNVNDIT